VSLLKMSTLSHSLVRLAVLPSEYLLSEFPEEVQRALLGKEVSELVLGINSVDLDDLVFDILAKVMVLDINVARSWAHLGCHS